MCVICLEYKKHKDLADARRMLEAAKYEPLVGIDEKHLKQIEDVLNYREKLLKRKMK